MRILVIMLLFASVASAQVDSTEIKLKEYKDLYDKGLINEQEYGELKRKALEIERPQQGTVVIYPKQDTVDMEQLHRAYKTQYVVGSLSLASSAAFLVTSFHFRNKPFYRDYNGVSVRVGYHTREARIFFVFSGIFAGVSIYSFAKGAKNRNKYISILASPAGASMYITF